MFVTNKRINPPKEIDIGDGIGVKVVDQFKLLGVTIDNKLNFETFASLLKKQSTKKCTASKDYSSSDYSISKITIF
jgi:hypothetical protein